MPYIDTPGDIFKITMAFVYTNEQVQESGVQFALGPCGGQDSRTVFAGQIDSLVAVHILPYLSADTKYYGCRVASARGRMPWAPVFTKQNTAGSVVGPHLPTQARVKTKWGTAFVGKKYRGRTYWPTPADSELGADGHPSTGYCTALSIVSDTLKNMVPQLGTTWTPVIHHKVPQGDPPVISDTILTQVVPQRWCTQRRGGDLGTTQGLPW